MGLGDIWYQHLYTIKYHTYIGYTLVMNTSGKNAQHIYQISQFTCNNTCMYSISNSLQDKPTNTILITSCAAIFPTLSDGREIWTLGSGHWVGHHKWPAGKKGWTFVAPHWSLMANSFECPNRGPNLLAAELSERSNLNAHAGDTALETSESSSSLLLYGHRDHKDC